MDGRSLRETGIPAGHNPAAATGQHETPAVAADYAVVNAVCMAGVGLWRKCKAENLQLASSRRIVDATSFSCSMTAMKSAHFNAWLSDRVEFQTKIVMGAIGGMVAIGLAALAVQGGLLFIMLQWGYGTGVAIVTVTGIFGSIGYFTYLTAPKIHKDQRHRVMIRGEKVRVSFAPTIAASWTFAFGSLDSDQSIPERIFAMFMIVPRMFWTAWHLSQRIQDVKEIDVEDCGRVLRMVLKKAERVEVTEIAEKFPKMDIPRTMRQVSLIDGVVFLTKESVGLSLARRFHDDLEKWLDSTKDQSGGDSDTFDGT